MVTLVCVKCDEEFRQSSLLVSIGAGKVTVTCAKHGRIAQLVSTGDDNNLNPTGLRLNLSPK